MDLVAFMPQTTQGFNGVLKPLECFPGFQSSKKVENNCTMGNIISMKTWGVHAFFMSLPKGLVLKVSYL